MSTSREGPNPLRPYVIPPKADPVAPPKQNASTGGTQRTRTSAASNLGSSARDMLSDLDYSDYLNDASPSFAEMLKTLVDQGVWKYTSVLLAQPFDVAKTVLQVQLASAVEEARLAQTKAEKPVRKESRQYDLEDDDSGDDSSSYFTSAAPLSPRTPRTPRVNRRHFASRSPSPETPSTSSRGRRGSKQAASAHTIALRSTSSLTAAVSYLWQSEGAWGVWKGTNSTFIHNVLLSSLTTFLRSLLCAVLALPDPSLPTSSSTSVPGGLDILSSPSPIGSLIATTTAAALAALILAPVDIARTRLMLTPSTHPPRSLPSTLRKLGTWLVPASLAPATILHGSLPTLVATSMPLFCRSRLGIDPILTPTPYAVATFTSQALEIILRMPVETVLRRGQIAFVNDHENAITALKTGRQAKASRIELETVVPVGPYRGLIGTMYHIAFEEGERTSKTEQAKDGLARASGKADAVRSQGEKKRRGQGIEGLYRGWRVGAWGLLGVWGAAMLGGPGKGGEF